MKKVYFLSTCSTCKRIMDDLGEKLDSFSKQDIKAEQISMEQIEEMRAFAGSYESLFSRKAMKFRSMGLNEKVLSEDDYKNLILEEYTFLKRPVFITDDKIFIGNAKANIEKLKSHLG